MSIHDGHRSRVRERFLKEGMDNFQPHEVLEFLLFYSNARGDTNATAHNLINKFGSLAEVFDAPISELVKVDGIGEISAVLIKMIPGVLRQYMLSQRVGEEKLLLTDRDNVKKYLLPYFVGKTNENVYLVLLDDYSYPIDCIFVCEGTSNSAELDLRKMVGLVADTKSSNLLLAHNHPNGTDCPSEEDIAMTEKLAAVFNDIGIRLLDHFIVTRNDVVSMLDKGYVEFEDGVLKDASNVNYRSKNSYGKPRRAKRIKR